MGEFKKLFFLPVAFTVRYTFIYITHKHTHTQRRYRDLQRFLNLLECALGLVEKSIYDFLAELAILVVVHFQNLVEGRMVDAVGHFGEVRGGLLGLGKLVSLPSVPWPWCMCVGIRTVSSVVLVEAMIAVVVVIVGVVRSLLRQEVLQ